MKILITTDLFSTATNGVVTSLTNLWKELEKLGHDVCILTVSEDTHSRKEGNVYYIRSMPFPVYPDVRMPLSYHHRLIKDIIFWKPDIIHSQCEFFSYQFAQYISGVCGAPIVHTYHTLYEQYVTYVIPSRRLGARVIKSFSRNRLKSASRVIAPSYKVQEVLEEYGLHNALSVVPSGISLEQHYQRIGEEKRREKRHALGFDDEDVVLLNLGRLGTEKNIDELIRFFATATKTIDHLQFMIVGDGPAKEALEELAKECGVADRVVFTGMVPPTEVQEYYQTADIFMSGSTSETQGLTYVEAAANGLPMLCREDPCLIGIVEEGQNGYQYHDEATFLEALEKMVSDSEWRKNAGERSEAITKAYDKAAFAKAVEELYYSVLEINKDK